jgi:hypothetical protein
MRGEEVQLGWDWRRFNPRSGIHRLYRIEVGGYTLDVKISKGK